MFGSQAPLVPKRPDTGPLLRPGVFGVGEWRLRSRSALFRLRVLPTRRRAPVGEQAYPTGLRWGLGGLPLSQAPSDAGTPGLSH